MTRKQKRVVRNLILFVAKYYLLIAGVISILIAINFANKPYVRTYEVDKHYMPTKILQDAKIVESDNLKTLSDVDSLVDNGVTVKYAYVLKNRFTAFICTDEYYMSHLYLYDASHFTSDKSLYNYLY